MTRCCSRDQSNGADVLPLAVDGGIDSPIVMLRTALAVLLPYDFLGTLKDIDDPKGVERVFEYLFPCLIETITSPRGDSFCAGIGA